MKRRRVPLDVCAELAVTLASLAVAEALAELTIEILLGDLEHRKVWCCGDGRGNFVVRRLTRRFVTPCAKLINCPPPPLFLLELLSEPVECLRKVLVICLETSRTRAVA